MTTRSLRFAGLPRRNRPCFQEEKLLGLLEKPNAVEFGCCSLRRLRFHFLHRGLEVPQRFFHRQRVHITAESLARFQCGL
jgi:hypothetical protein